MNAPMMKAYSDLLVQTCHKRGAFAIGGMAAFIPSKDPEVNERAFAKVTEDKKREVAAGFDGSWVAHPGMVDLCKEIFTGVLGDSPNQLDKQRDDVSVTADDLLDAGATPGERTMDGLRANVSVGIQYLQAWLEGNGAVGIHNLMEDAATAEISRSQIWPWLHSGATLASGETVTRELVDQVVEQEYAGLRETVGEEAFAAGSWEAARRLFVECALDPEFPDFLTLPAYAEVLRVERQR
jgi:malate synthase